MANIFDLPWEEESVQSATPSPSGITNGANQNERVRVAKESMVFDISMRREERDIEADYTFIIWLGRSLSGGAFADGSINALGIEEARKGLCVDPSSYPKLPEALGLVEITDFVPDFPAEEDFESSGEGFDGVKNNPAFQEEYLLAVHKSIRAKNVCKQCPVKTKCLIDSIFNGDEFRDAGQNANVRPEPGIWGGRDIKDRKSVARKFKALRNEYLNGDMAPERVRMYERKARKFIQDRAEIEG